MYITTNPVNQELYKNFEAVRACSNNKNAAKDVFSEKQETKKEKLNLPALYGTIIGTLASLLFIRKYQGRSIEKEFIKLSKSNGLKTNLNAVRKNVLSFLHLDAGLKEFLILGTGSILGGLTGGIVFDKDKNTKNKAKEGVYQFLNLALPAFIVDRLLKLTKKNEKFNNKYAQIGAAVIGIGGGMPVASKISNKINDSIIDKNSKYERPMKLKDCIIHVDDIVMALILAKVPFVSKLGIDKMLPFLYLPGGYETGKQK